MAVRLAAFFLEFFADFLEALIFMGLIAFLGDLWCNRNMILVLHNIRSSYNVGAILRTAEGMGVSRVICSGYTPFVDGRSGRLPHVVAKERERILKTALLSEEVLNGGGPVMALEYATDVILRLKELSREGYVLAGLENNVEDGRLVRLLGRGRCLYRGEERDLKEVLGSVEEGDFDGSVGERLVLVLGEEVSGIAPEVMDVLDFLVEIPMRGRKESFNVSVAAVVGMWELGNI